jgi:hypothetical protein
MFHRSHHRGIAHAHAAGGRERGRFGDDGGLRGPAVLGVRGYRDHRIDEARAQRVLSEGRGQPGPLGAGCGARVARPVARLRYPKEGLVPRIPAYASMGLTLQLGIVRRNKLASAGAGLGIGHARDAAVGTEISVGRGIRGD